MIRLLCIIAAMYIGWLIASRQFKPQIKELQRELEQLQEMDQ